MLALPATLLGACINGELGTEYVTDKHETDVHLTAGSPVAVRHLTFEAGPTADSMEASVEIRAIRSRDDEVYEAPDGVSISVRPDDPSEMILDAGRVDGTQPGAIVSFIQWCRTGCHGGARVIVRADDPAALPSDVRIVTTFRIVAPGPRASALDADPRIGEEEAGRIDGLPSASSSSATKTVELSNARRTGHVDLQLHADGDAVAAARRDSLVGSLVVRGDGDDATDALLGTSIDAVGFYKVKDRGGSLASDDVPADLLDWLAACPPSGDCDLTIGIDLSYEHLASAATVRAALDNRSASPTPRVFRIDLDATARLEAFDGRTLPADSVKLTMTGGR